MEELEGHVLIERVLIVNISAKYSSFPPLSRIEIEVRFVEREKK